MPGVKLRQKMLVVWIILYLEPVWKSGRQDGQPEDDEDGGQLDHCFIV